MLSCLWPWWNWAPKATEGHLELEVCSKVTGIQCLWRLALPPMSCVQQHLPLPCAPVEVLCATHEAQGLLRPLETSGC